MPIDFFDSNVLIAAVIESHTHHTQSRSRMQKLARSGGCCSTNTLAEAYNTLTSERATGYGLDPGQVAQMLEGFQTMFTPITLTPRETIRALEATALLKLRGAMVYDALIVACARKADARFIYTFNVRHFNQVAPYLSARIREP